jgi:hypothetical protein
MRTTPKLIRDFTLTSVLVFAVCVLHPLTVIAQWTTPDANQNINNTNTGNVGVGNTAPKYKLDVQGSANNAQIRFGIDSADSGGFLFSIQPAHATFAAGASWSNFGWTARALNASSITADSGTLRFYGNSNLTPDTAFTPTERMRISPFGFVGIGTTNPTSKLHLMSNTDSGTTLLSLDTGVHGGTSMAVFGTTNNESGFDMSVYRAGQYFSRFGVGPGGHLYLQPSGGNVGIGTATPSYPLEVVAASQWVARFKKTDATNGGVIVDSATGYNPNFALFVNGAPKWYLLNNVSNADALQFWDSTGNNARFTLTQAGTVGIGTPTPNASYKLDVAGAVRSSTGGFVFPDGTIQTTAAVGGGGGTITGVTAGSGMTGGGTTGTVTLTNDDKGSSQNIFKNVANSAGTNQFSATSNNDAVRFAGAGGTTVTFDAATKKVMIDGSTSTVSAANISAGQFGAGNYTFPSNVTVVGTLEGGTIKAKYQDMAEWVESSQDLQAGTVVVVDSQRSNQVVASTQAYDSRVAGVISLQPGIALGEQREGRVLVATTGRVKVQVDARNGPINIGDLLVTSDKPGVAMKSAPVEIGGVRIHRPGTLIGKALEPLAQGTGEILVLLSLQ